MQQQDKTNSDSGIAAYWSGNSHGNLIRVRGRDRILDTYFIDMDYYELNLARFLETESIDLRKHECSGNPVDTPCCKRCIIQGHEIIIHITRGLVFLHSKDIAYEILKPRNGLKSPGVCSCL